MNLAAAEQLIAKHEGYRSTVYTDTMGKATIGYGFNLEDPTAIDTCEAHGLNISELLNGAILPKSFAWAVMADQVMAAYFSATKIFPHFDSLPEAVQCVVVDMLVQMGEPVFQTFEDTIACINSGDFMGAADCMRKSKWYSEVPARALEDCSLMEDGVFAK